MNIEKLTIISATAVLAVSMVSSLSAQEGYVQDGSGIAVRDSAGECVLAAGGNILEECIPAAAPIMADPVPVKVAPKPVYVPPPAPKPRPAPIVKVLNLNEAGGSNFAFDSANLTDKARGQLSSFVSNVKSSNVAPTSITVVGHTDSIGSEAYNQTLSEKRANSVASYLNSQGMNRGIMQVSGRGESQPAASNKTKAGRAENRRVDIRVTGQRKITVR